MALDDSELPKISEYGVIGNGRTAALVSNRGSIDWCCLPRFDSPSIFARLVAPRRGGYFEICPIGPFRSFQSYVPDTNVLQTRFETESGAVTLKDAFSVTSEAEKRRRLWPDQEILRIVEGVRGEVRMRFEWLPRPEYGRQHLQLEKREKFGIALSGGNHLLLLQTTVPYSQCNLNSGAHAEFVIRAGERCQFSLTFAEESPAVCPPLGAPVFERMEMTEKYWREWVALCKYEGDYPEAVRRSALALKLMAFAPSGAVIAAPTTSLPEWKGGKRNWDYRYCWLRDASFTIRALYDLGFEHEAQAYMGWMLYTTRLSRPGLQVLYSVYGDDRLDECNLEDFDGYANSKPVRIGNQAHDQVQIDVYGEALNSLFYITNRYDHLDRETQRFALHIGNLICKIWNRPDNGIWELRGDGAQHTHSKVLAWVALDRIIRMSSHFRHRVAPLDRYWETRTRIREAVEAHGFNAEIGSYTTVFGGREVDASLLQFPLVGYCDPRSPRMLGTIRAIQRELTKEEWVYRYRPGRDGIDEPEGAFGICGFWMIEALARAGELERATQWFEKILSRSNSLGLWSEEVDPDTGEYLGNYPQGFTHIGLINAAMTLEREKQKKMGRAA